MNTEPLMESEDVAAQDRRAIIAELHKIKGQLEANLRALALVRLTNLLRRIDAESQSEGK